MLISGFDWDDGNREKCRKHGVSQHEIEALFRSTPYVAPDLKHSRLETRFIAIGRNETGRPLFVAFAIRERASELWIRPISARYMHAKEAGRYDQQGPGSDK